MVSYTNSAAILLSLSSLTTAGAASGRKLSWSSGDSHDDNTTSDSPTYYPTTWSGDSHDDNDNGWKSSSSSSSKDAWGPSFKCIPKTNPGWQAPKWSGSDDDDDWSSGTTTSKSAKTPSWKGSSGSKSKKSKSTKEDATTSANVSWSGSSTSTESSADDSWSASSSWKASSSGRRLRGHHNHRKLSDDWETATAWAPSVSSSSSSSLSSDSGPSKSWSGSSGSTKSNKGTSVSSSDTSAKSIKSSNVSTSSGRTGSSSSSAKSNKEWSGSTSAKSGKDASGDGKGSTSKSGKSTSLSKGSKSKSSKSKSSKSWNHSPSPTICESYEPTAAPTRCEEDRKWWYNPAHNKCSNYPLPADISSEVLKYENLPHCCEEYWPNLPICHYEDYCNPSKPSSSPSAKPTKSPSQKPSPKPSSSPTKEPTPSPSASPNEEPTTSSPTTSAPTTCEGRKWHYSPSIEGCTNDFNQDYDPDDMETYDSARECCKHEFGFYNCDIHDICEPTASPTVSPTLKPSKSPSVSPTGSPTKSPSASPTELPSGSPTLKPSKSPTKKPSSTPSSTPTKKPSTSPSGTPTKEPSVNPTSKPTSNPTSKPTSEPTIPQIVLTPSSSPTVCDINRLYWYSGVGTESCTNADVPSDDIATFEDYETCCNNQFPDDESAFNICYANVTDVCCEMDNDDWFFTQIDESTGECTNNRNGTTSSDIAYATSTECCIANNPETCEIDDICKPGDVTVGKGGDTPEPFRTSQTDIKQTASNDFAELTYTQKVNTSCEEKHDNVWSTNSNSMNKVCVYICQVTTNIYEGDTLWRTNVQKTHSDCPAHGEGPGHEHTTVSKWRGQA